MPGPVTLRYWGSQLARQGPDAEVVRPTHATFQQLQEVERKAEAAAAATQEEQIRIQRERKVLHIDFGSGVHVPVTVSVSELRDILGLPDYNLNIPLLREPVATTTEAPDLLDVEHMSEVV